MDLTLITSPVIGGIIGYVTNGLAIKMLFRPYKPIYIGKWKLPFTPGLIPNQKENIALSIAEVINSQLLDTATIKDTILSEENISSVRKSIISYMENFNENPITTEEYIKSYISDKHLEESSLYLKEKIARLIIEKIAEADIGSIIVNYGMEAFSKKSANKLMKMLISDDTLNHIKENLTVKIDNIINEKSPEIIKNEIDKTFTELSCMPLSEIYNKYSEDIPDITDKLLVFCCKFIEKNIDGIMKKINIKNIVYNKISSFDARELEKLIFEIAHKELNAIIYLGSLLGFIIGFIYVLI